MGFGAISQPLDLSRRATEAQKPRTAHMSRARGVEGSGF